MGRLRTLSSIALSLVVVFGGAAAAQWRLPLTVDGHPDLEGVWDFATMTPLQRQARFSGREFMTYEEAVAFGREAMANVEIQRQAGLGGGAIDE